jgi:hypothetical protein
VQLDRHSECPQLAYSVEKLRTVGRLKNPGALDGSSIEGRDRIAASDDVPPQSL